jgi:ribonucleoside-diphosphate reductase alpha chain
MAKYLVETYYTCTFKVNHYLDDINETELKNLEKRDDGKFEVLDVKLDNRKTKSLDPKIIKLLKIKKLILFLKKSNKKKF